MFIAFKKFINFLRICKISATNFSSFKLAHSRFHVKNLNALDASSRTSVPDWSTLNSLCSTQEYRYILNFYRDKFQQKFCTTNNNNRKMMATIGTKHLKTRDFAVASGSKALIRLIFPIWKQIFVYSVSVGCHWRSFDWTVVCHFYWIDNKVCL